MVVRSWSGQINCFKSLNASYPVFLIVPSKSELLPRGNIGWSHLMRFGWPKFSVPCHFSSHSSLQAAGKDIRHCLRLILLGDKKTSMSLRGLSCTVRVFFKKARYQLAPLNVPNPFRSSLSAVIYLSLWYRFRLFATMTR